MTSRLGDGPRCKCGGRLYSEGPSLGRRGVVERFKCGKCRKSVRTLRPDTEAEYWRAAGYNLVMRFGNTKERADAKARRISLRRINRVTAAWLAQQQEAA